MNKIQIESINHQNVKIEDFKTTFVVLNVENNSYRLNYIKKKEVFLKQKDDGILKYYSEHPLLINHNESTLEVYINSSPADISTFINEIEHAINFIIKGWRSWKEYIEINSGIHLETFKQNIKDGNGKLLNASISIVESIEKICIKHQVKIKVFGERRYARHKLIIINNQFMIAKDFQLHPK